MHFCVVWLKILELPLLARVVLFLRLDWLFAKLNSDQLKTVCSFKRKDHGLGVRRAVKWYHLLRLNLLVHFEQLKRNLSVFLDFVRGRHMLVAPLVLELELKRVEFNFPTTVRIQIRKIVDLLLP